jgi:hypothetical protein
LSPIQSKPPPPGTILSPIRPKVLPVSQLEIPYQARILSPIRTDNSNSPSLSEHFRKPPVISKSFLFPRHSIYEAVGILEGTMVNYHSPIDSYHQKILQLIRQAIKYSQMDWNINDDSNTFKLVYKDQVIKTHNAIVEWFDTLPDPMKPFKSLQDFANDGYPLTPITDQDYIWTRNTKVLQLILLMTVALTTIHKNLVYYDLGKFILSTLKPQPTLPNLHALAHHHPALPPKPIEPMRISVSSLEMIFIAYRIQEYLLRAIYSADRFTYPLPFTKLSLNSSTGDVVYYTVGDVLNTPFGNGSNGQQNVQPNGLQNESGSATTSAITSPVGTIASGGIASASVNGNAPLGIASATTTTTSGNTTLQNIPGTPTLANTANNTVNNNNNNNTVISNNNTVPPPPPPPTTTNTPVGNRPPPLSLSLDPTIGYILYTTSTLVLQHILLNPSQPIHKRQYLFYQSLHKTMIPTLYNLGRIWNCCFEYAERLAESLPDSVSE